MTTFAAPRIRRTAQNTQFTHNLNRRVHDIQTYPVLSPRPQPAPKEKQNGTSEDTVMILDSDDDEPAASKPKDDAPFVDKPAFEDEAPNEPYPEVVQTLDLSLGTAGLHIAKLVFAVSCANSEVYLLTLPLTPPSPESKARPELKSGLLAGRPGSGVWGESMVLLAAYFEKEPAAPSTPRAVVAAHNLEGSGTLRLWDVSLDLKTGMAQSAVEAFQTEFLPSPLSSISFNLTHMTQLLAVFATRAVRIYDYATPSISPTNYQLAPFRHKAPGSSLFTPFLARFPHRKPIVDAAWISRGRAILVLLADGTSPLRAGAPEEKPRQSGEFVPMTPHSRKDAQVSLSSAAVPYGRLVATRGGISVVAHPVSGTMGSDESVVLWIGTAEHVCVIPGIMSFWSAQIRKSGGGGVNLFSGAQPTRMIKLHDLSVGLLGERCCGVSAIVDLNKAKGDGKSDGGLGVEVLIRGESRMVVLRESEDGPGRKIGGVVGTRRFLGDRTSSYPAPSFGKFGSVRAAKFGRPNDDESMDDDDDTHRGPTNLPSRPRTGLMFADSISAAADVVEDATERDVEVEMLDLMEIDRHLTELDELRGSGQKRVFSKTLRDRWRGGSHQAETEAMGVASNVDIWDRSRCIGAVSSLSPTASPIPDPIDRAQRAVKQKVEYVHSARTLPLGAPHPPSAVTACRRLKKEGVHRVPAMCEYCRTKGRGKWLLGSGRARDDVLHAKRLIDDAVSRATRGQSPSRHSSAGSVPGPLQKGVGGSDDALRRRELLVRRLEVVAKRYEEILQSWGGTRSSS
ncbi:unnamed protein product [Parascedosporium putredinis]|uniref:Uncharacterized protein n=1 Tax=Parascedosporium putredinis TaxID=1442378 RepID=A0A9P1H2B2_9PEZI|nr:unnamed protein product [Parascedosporium putredinis]CAI7994777.1 unnamed protein product [Parascedosporium putredinis]